MGQGAEVGERERKGRGKTTAIGPGNHGGRG